MATVGELLSTCRPRYTTHLLLLLAAAVTHSPGRLMAQERVIERHVFDEPEGRLLAFYSATMAFTPGGLTAGNGWSVGIEMSYVPFLNEAQRRPSLDKPEATNLVPFFPRPRLGVRFAGLYVEGSWIPPMRVFDVEANLLSGSISGVGWAMAGWHISPRVWGATGRVRGTITCAASAMVGKGADLETYYATVCHGRESDDWFEPRMLGAEAIAVRVLADGALRAYVGAGARVDRSRFDIGVLTGEGVRDPDHPILELRATRPHFTLGAGWHPRGRIATGAELFYAPGSVLTARATVRWSARP